MLIFSLEAIYDFTYILKSLNFIEQKVVS